VRRFGVPAAVGLVSDGIQRTARYAGVPQKYHATISRGWAELVGHHAAEHGEDDFTVESTISNKSSGSSALAPA
jgi:hypothetical protein